MYGMHFKWRFSFTGSAQPFKVPESGVYFLQAYGASASNTKSRLGFRGGYAAANVFLTVNQLIYVYVGQHIDKVDSGVFSYLPAYNGGGAGGRGYWSSNAIGTSGGGATDFRFQGGEWNDSVSLLSRFIVAGGAGGQDHYNGYKGTGLETLGCGGGVEGQKGSWGRFDTGYSSLLEGEGGKKTRGGKDNDGVIRSGFGFGADGMPPPYPAQQIPGSGGGGGYYGGGGGKHGNHASSGGGGGGSSFVFSHPDCIPHQNHTIPGSLIITNMNIIPGYSLMPNPGGGEMYGNLGNGFALISHYGSSIRKAQKSSMLFSFWVPLLMTNNIKKNN